MRQVEKTLQGDASAGLGCTVLTLPALLIYNAYLFFFFCCMMCLRLLDVFSNIWLFVLCLFFFNSLYLIVMLSYVVILVTLCYTKLIT